MEAKDIVKGAVNHYLVLLLQTSLNFSASKLHMAEKFQFWCWFLEFLEIRQMSPGGWVAHQGGDISHQGGDIIIKFFDLKINMILDFSITKCVELTT